MISSAALGSVLAAEGVVNGIFQSLVLSVAGWAGLRVFKRLSAPLRSGILFTLLVLLALLPFRMIFLRSAPPSSIRIPLSTVRTESSEMSGVPLMGIKDRAGVERASRAVARTSPEPERAPGFESAPASSSLPFHPVLAGLNLFGLIWIAGFLFSFGRLLHGIRFLLGFKNGLREIRDEKSAEAFEIIRASFPGRTLPSLYASLSAQSPLAFGIFRPAIVVPQSLYHHLSRAELQSVLIHETAHIWHKDHLSGLLQRLVTAVYWWNPLARILSAEYSVVREQVSDNYAIRKDGARSYARCLVALAQKTTLMTRLPLVVGMATPRFSFEKRIIGIVSEKRALKTKLGRRAVVCLATAAVFTMAILGTFAWTLGPDGRFSKTIPLPVDIDPQSLTVDKDWLYIHNSKHNLTPKDPMDIKIFSQKDFSLFKTFDRRGEGQGEFLTAPGRLQIVGDSLWIENFRKFEVFSKDGSYLKTTTIPEDLWLLEYPLLPVGDHFVGFVVSRDDIRRGIHRYYGRTYDKDFRFVKQFYDDIPFVTPPPPPPPPPPVKPGQTPPKDSPQAPPVVKADYFTIPDCLDFGVANDNIFVADTRKGFHISVFDQNGNPVYDIDKDFRKLRVTTDYQAAYLQKIKQHSPWLSEVANFRFREFYPAFMGFKIADDKIYIFTYAKEGNFHELIVMNLKGDILRRGFMFPIGPSFDSVYDNFARLKDKFGLLDGKVYYLARNVKTGSAELRIRGLE